MKPLRRIAPLCLLVVVAAAPGAARAAGEGAADPAAGPASPDVAYRFALAKSLVFEGRFAEAIERFEDVVAAVPGEPYVRLELADLLLRLGRLERAAEEVDAAVAAAPDNVDVLRLAGRIHLVRAQRDGSGMEAARRAFERLRELAPHELRAMIALGEIYLDQGEPAAAAEVFLDVYRARPDSRPVFDHLVDALLRAGRREEAEEVLHEILAAHPDYTAGRLALADLQSERGDHAAAAGTLAATPAPDRDADVRRRLALQLFQAGRGAEAMEAVEAALALDPDHRGARYLRGLLLAASGEAGEAEEAFRELLDEDPGNAELSLRLAGVLEEQGEVAEAESLLAGAAEEAEERGDAAAVASLRLELAYLLARAERWEEGLEELDRLHAATGEEEAAPEGGTREEAALLRVELLSRLERLDQAVEALDALLEGTDPAARPRLAARQARLLFELGREGEGRALLTPLAGSGDASLRGLAAEVYQQAELYAESIPLLERNLEEEPQRMETLFFLGAAYERTGRHGEAESFFRRLLAQSPDFAPALNYLGYMWAERGENLEEALALTGRAVKLEPDNGAYVDSLGWALYQLGRYDEARGHLERAAELVPDDAVVHEHLGDLYAALGRAEAAEQAYRRALAMDGENGEAVQRKLRELGDGGR